MGSLRRQGNIRGDPIIGKRTQRETRVHFFTVKEANGWSATPWENQLVSDWSVKSWNRNSLDNQNLVSGWAG